MLSGIDGETPKGMERSDDIVGGKPIHKDDDSSVNEIGIPEFATNVPSNNVILATQDRDDTMKYLTLDSDEFIGIPAVIGQKIEQDTTDERVMAEAYPKLNMACRTGDIDTVQTLLDTPGLDINHVDKWDYSPLILLSICGHKKVVEMLLSRGAVCERDTFQGARCIYGALNDEIRDLLISFDMTKAVDISQPFAAHISSILNPSQIPTKDIIFHFPHAVTKVLQTLRLNRFLLAARSSYFHQKLTGDWKEEMVIVFPNTVDPGVFKIIINYIYLKSDFLPIDDKQIQPQLEWLAKKLCLEDLHESIQKVKDVEHTFTSSIAKVKHEYVSKYIFTARDQLKEYLNRQVLGNKHVSSLDLEEEEEVDIEDIDFEITDEIRLGLNVGSVDLILSCLDAKSETAVYYPVDKAVAIRSEYFDTMLKSDMVQSTLQELPLYNGKLGSSIVIRPSLSPEHFPVIRIGTSVSSSVVAEIVLSFLYHDVVEIPLEESIAVTFAADELFLDRLKSISTTKFTSSLKFSKEEFSSLVSIVGYDAYDLIRVSWQTRNERLERHVTKMIAYNIHKIFHNEEERFKILALIQESANRIKERQFTDTIELIDDIRFNLIKKYDIVEYEIPEKFDYDDKSSRHAGNHKFYQDISLIEELLDELHLDA